MPEYMQLSAFRKSKRLSLRFIAKKTGVSSATICRLEQGKEVEHGNWKKICNFYKDMENN